MLFLRDTVCDRVLADHRIRKVHLPFPTMSCGLMAQARLMVNISVICYQVLVFSTI